jgi:hypothetical protein
MPERALNGLRVPQASASGTVEELLRAWITPSAAGRPAPLAMKDNGKPRAGSTVKQYVWTVKRS